MNARLFCQCYQKQGKIESILDSYLLLRIIELIFLNPLTLVVWENNDNIISNEPVENSSMYNNYTQHGRKKCWREGQQNASSSYISVKCYTWFIVFSFLQESKCDIGSPAWRIWARCMACRSWLGLSLTLKVQTVKTMVARADQVPAGEHRGGLHG